VSGEVTGDESASALFNGALTTSKVVGWPAAVVAAAVRGAAGARSVRFH
jgi:hypothetical protein